MIRAQIPRTNINRYNPMFPLCTFFPCDPKAFAADPKLNTNLESCGSMVSLLKFEIALIGLTSKAV